MDTNVRGGPLVGQRVVERFPISFDAKLMG